jgi:hypothetical protein
LFEPECAQGGENNHRAGQKRFAAAVPVEVGFDQKRDDCAESLAMWAMLPAEHFPERVRLKQCRVVEILLIHKEDVGGVVGNQSEQANRESDSRDEDQWQNPKGLLLRRDFRQGAGRGFSGIIFDTTGHRRLTVEDL